MSVQPLGVRVLAGSAPFLSDSRRQCANTREGGPRVADKPPSGTPPRMRGPRLVHRSLEPGPLESRALRVAARKQAHGGPASLPRRRVAALPRRIHWLFEEHTEASDDKLEVGLAPPRA